VNLLDVLDEETRIRIGKIHSSFMGGEYLPVYGPGQIEIARIELESTTSDVISVRKHIQSWQIRKTKIEQDQIG